MSPFFRLLILTLFLFFTIGCKKQKPVQSLPVLINNQDLPDATKNTDNYWYLPTSTTGVVIKHKYYTLSYNEPFEQAQWVAYQLKKQDLSGTNYDRPYFIDDPAVRTGSASWRNYKNSGYDKGHLCPAGDRKFSLAAFNETFYTSNISPQEKKFNTGVWNRLEQKTRYWAYKYDGLYVITAGVLQNGLKTIGKEKVAVPNYFYKILINKTNGNYKAIAFLLPNKDSDAPLSSFVVSIDSIEKITGIDFFANLPDSVEQVLEKNTDYKQWSF